MLSAVVEQIFYELKNNEIQGQIGLFSYSMHLLDENPLTFQSILLFYSNKKSFHFSFPFPWDTCRYFTG